MKTNYIKVVAAFVALSMGIARAQVPHVYINPGHGGHDSDDRNVVIPPFAAGDTAGFWESNSNLKKGFALQELLRKKGYRTSISRLRNETANDLPLSTIVSLCNSSGADVFYSIHSNAVGYGEPRQYNYPLGIYRGYTGQPQVPGSDQLAADLGYYLVKNKSTVWSNGGSYMNVGDWTFRSDWGTQGYGVLRGNMAVSMLSEGSHHDYYPETYRLLNDDYCWVEGWHFSLGADRYFGRTDNYNLGIVTGNVRDDRLLRDATYIMNGDDRRRPVNNATVRLLDGAGNELALTHTDNLDNGIYLFKYLEPGNYKVEVSEDGYFTMVKEVTVESNNSTYCNFDLKRQRTTPPEVVDYSPRWIEGESPVPCNVPIMIQFNWDMDVESVEQAFTITPDVDGTFSWEDTNYRMIFTPKDAFEINTLYTVTIKKDAMHGGGTPMDNDFEFCFNTQSRNHLEVLSMFPCENALVHFAKPLVEFRSDSLLNNLGLYSKIRVLNSEGYEMAWAKRSIKNNKRGDAFGYIKLPLSYDLIAGNDYYLEVDQDVEDTASIHLEAPIRVAFKVVDASLMAAREKILLEVEDSENVSLLGAYATANLSLSTNHLYGEKSLSIDYDFNEANDPNIRLDFATKPVVQYGDTIIMHVWGDMSFNELSVRLVPVTSENVEENVSIGDIDFHGWKKMSFVVPGNGKYNIEELILANSVTNARKAKQGTVGTLILDDMTCCENSNQDSAVDDITLGAVSVGPNPASEYLVASAPAWIQGVELVDMDGNVIARHSANYINVGNIASGLYVMRVYVSGLVSSHKVVVAH